ncbi:MAG TPA: hypothetical protein VJM11_20245 [Nevskiaceae bacterium]|nr:hypothetical protein [Nevskiaceae bacterium]
MSNLVIVRSYEIVTILIYLASFFWLLRLRNPVYMGALLGATLVFGYDWAYTAKSFFNVTYNPDLLWIPGIEIMGIKEPLAIPFAYGMAFGPFCVALVMMRDKLDKAFGLWGYLVVWVIGAIGVMLYEVPVVHILHIWTYHQLPEHMLWGVPWSDIPLAGNLVAFTYAWLRWMERWAQLPPNAGFSLSSENTWKGFVMGGTAPWCGFYLTYVLQLWWYSYAEPWVDAGRPF